MDYQKWNCIYETKTLGDEKLEVGNHKTQIFRNRRQF